MLKSAIVLGIIPILLGCLIGTARAADTRACQIDRISGESVTVSRKLEGGWWTESSAGVTGQAIPATATLATGLNSRVVLLCSDDTIITIGPETEIALADLIGEAGPEQNVLLRLLRGIVGIVAPNQNWKRFDVETSLATASVRSTEWLVESYSGSGTAVFVALGSVEVVADQQLYVLEAGEGVTLQEAAADGPKPEVPQVKRWGEARISKSRSALGFDW